MKYSENVKKTLKLIYPLYDNQFDRDGVPLIFSVCHIAGKMEDEDALIVSLLMSAVNENKISLDELKELGYSDKVIDGLRRLKPRRRDSYMETIEKICRDPFASYVKMRELQATVSRIDRNAAFEWMRFEKEDGALEILLEQNEVFQAKGISYPREGEK